MLVVRHPSGYPAERGYTLDVVLREFLGLSYRAETHAGADVVIELAGESPARQLRVADVFFRTPPERWLTAASMPDEPLAHWKPPHGLPATAGTLPVLFPEAAAEVELVQYSESGARWGLDLFGSAFFLLTRYEEAVSDARDDHGRFPADASLASRAGFLDYPLVDAYVDVFWSILNRLWPRLVRRPRAYRVMLSHDVDRPFCVSGRSIRSVARSLAADVGRRRDLDLAVRRLRSLAAARRGDIREDPCDTFDFIMEHSERHGRRSAFYFMAGREVRGIDADYDIDSPWIRRLIRRIGERGHEIGLHPSYLTWTDSGRLAAEFGRLRAVAEQESVHETRWGGRQHYLRWQNPETWQGWEDAGLAYDSTLGYPERPGFRCGVGREFPVFNLRTRTPLRLRERPLVLMDTALFGHAAPGGRKMLDAALALRDTCRRFRADLTILWHNSNLLSRRQKAEYSALCEAL